MKLIWKSNKLLLFSFLFTIALFLSLYIPVHLPGNPFAYTYDGASIILRYEIFGCGSLIRTIEKGGEALYAKANIPAPESGVYELRFSEDSDEPELHIESAEFYIGGLAEKYSYYMSVEIVGVSEGVPECCEPKPAYNEIVPLVKVAKWKPTTFTPELYFTTRHYLTILILVPLILLNASLLIHLLYNRIKSKIS